MLRELGDDPHWGGEYLLDISTPAKRRRIADLLQPMIETCARKGFDAVEYDNLDSSRDGTPRRAMPSARPRRSPTRRGSRATPVAGRRAEEHGRAHARQARGRIGFDFAIAEECGRYRECDGYRRVYGNHVIAIEYRRRDFRAACRAVGREVGRPPRP